MKMKTIDEINAKRLQLLKAGAGVEVSSAIYALSWVLGERHTVLMRDEVGV